jgi:hypothetical protein
VVETEDQEEVGLMELLHRVQARAVTREVTVGGLEDEVAEVEELDQLDLITT